MLSGCGEVQTFETIQDACAPGQPSEKKVFLSLPQEAVREAMAKDESEAVYLCQNYEIFLNTEYSGDLDRTVRAMTGMNPEALTIMHTGPEQERRYDFVWTTTGEDAVMVGRGAILDDGEQHHCLSVLAPEQAAADLQTSWDSLFRSFCFAE